MECFRLLFDHLVWIEHQVLSCIRDLIKAGSLWGMMRGMGGVWKSWLVKGLGLGLLCWGQHSWNRVSSISTKTIRQSITPSFSQTIWPRRASRQFLSLTIVQTLLPVTWLFPILSSEAVVMRQLRRWKKLWRRSLTRSHKRSSTGPSRSCWNGTTSTLQPDDITSKGTRVSCVYYQ